MADGPPKDYSIIDQEESPPLPPIRVTQKNIWSDGSVSVPQHRESGVDLAAVARKLRATPAAEIAMNSLKVHYSDVFGTRKHEQRHPPLPPPPQTQANVKIKAVINYVDENEVYIINVPQNTARMVKNLAPKRGNYRYFFELTDGAYEEIDLGDTKVPVHQKDSGAKCILCRAFNR